MRPFDIHRAWAPTDGEWSQWVKPVLFASINVDVEQQPHPPRPPWLASEVLAPLESTCAAMPGPYREGRVLSDTAIVIDLPSDEGTKLGLALTEDGFRPIPLYNAIPSRVAVVDMLPILEALSGGAEYVASASRSAPPAFLLDARRMRGDVGPGLFDNRSVCRPSDFPSAEVLRRAGIRRVLLLTEAVQTDLELVALEWQAAGLELWSKKPTERTPAAPLNLRRWWLGRKMWRYIVDHSYRRGTDGAYGALIEVPSGG